MFESGGVCKSRQSNSGTTGDVIDLILEDHELVRSLYSNLKDEGYAPAQKEQHFQLLLWSIAKHAVAEELVYYSLLEAFYGKQGQQIAEDHRKDHQETAEMIGKMEKLPYEKAAKDVDKMMKDLTSHMEKEESGDLMEVRRNTDKVILMDAAGKYEKIKHLIPSDKVAHNLPYSTPYGLASADRNKLLQIVALSSS